MELSLSGLIGAMVGSAVGALNYVAIVAYAEGWLRARHTVESAEERAAFEERVSVMRRSILGADILICAAVGYWFGKTIGG
jgi:hypothetical protein